MIGPLRAIAGTAFTDAVRQPIFIVVLLVGLGSVAASLPLSLFALGDEGKLFLDLAVSAVVTSGLLLAALLASGALARGLGDGAALATLAAPLPRPLYIAGTFLGIAWALGLACWVWGAALLLAFGHGVRPEGGPVDGLVVALGLGATLVAALVGGGASYLRRAPFGSTFAWTLAALLPVAHLIDRSLHHGHVHAAPYPEAQLIAMLLLATEAVWLVCAVGVAAASRLGQGATLAICFLVLVLGLAREPLLAPRAERPLASAEAAPATLAARGLRLVVPDLQRFAVADGITQGARITPRYLAWVSAYAAAMAAAWLALASALFEGRDAG